MSIDSISTGRISGISSGLDTEAIVKSLVQLDQTRVDKQFMEKTELEWKRDAYRDVNLLIKNFREENMSVLNSDKNMLSTFSYNDFSVNFPTETNAVSISAGSGSYEGSMTINSISKLATAPKVESSSIFNTSDISLDVALEDLDLKEPLQFVDDEIEFTINSESFVFSKDATLSEVLTGVNTNSDAGVIMSFSSLKEGFKLTSKQTGESSTIELVNVKGNAFSAGTNAFGISEGTYAGTNAELVIENVSVSRETNSFTIDDISYNLKTTSAESINFSIERNVESTIDKIKNFVDSYNTLIESLQKKLDEPVYRSFSPLTDAQRDEMSDTEQEKWDEKAKSGLLSNDSYVRGLINKLRESFYTTVSGTGMALYNIGLRTDSYHERGKIIIDESALREAIQENPSQIEKLFIQKSDSDDYSTKFSENGLVYRMSSLFTNYMSNANTNFIANTESGILQADTRMEELIKEMEENEERHWAKFTAMETALTKMNSQITALTNMLPQY